MKERQFTEEEVEDLTDRVFLLKARIEEGKFHVMEHLAEGFSESLRAIKLRADGKVDPYSVDGRIRATTLVIRAMQYREDAKRDVSLARIQNDYFDYLFAQFDWLYAELRKPNATPARIAAAASANDEIVKGVMAALPEIAEDLRMFWGAVAEAGSFHLQDGRQLKTSFAGDLFPAFWENAVSTAGLYVDTIVLPCPIMRIAPLIGLAPERDVVAMLVKHVVTAMTYREVATAEVDPPILLILPNEDDIAPGDRHGFVNRAGPAVCKHAARLFQRPFESVDDLREFCGKLDTIDKVLHELKEPKRLLFDSDWEPGVRAQLKRAMREGLPAIPGLDPAVAGYHVLGACLGRMRQALAAQEKAVQFGATPLINAETSWRYYTWLLEYQGAESKADARGRETMHVIRAIASERGNNLAWLGNVPVETVIEIRKKGLTDEVRALLGKGVSELIHIDPTNYFRTADQVIDNLDRAFQAHQQQLLEAKAKKLKLYGIDVAACLSVGAIGVAAAMTSNPGLGVVSAIAGVAGLPNLKDIKSKFSEILTEDRARRNSPTGLLFRHVRK